MAPLIPIVLAVILQTTLCSSTPSTVSQREMTEFMTSLWQSDVNRASDSDVTLSIQTKTTEHSQTDQAPNRLFSHVNRNVLRRPTFTGLINLLDNYHPSIGASENFTSSQLAEVDTFLDAVTNTSIMERTLRFLRTKGYVGQTMAALRQKMKSLWFTLYSRSSRHSHHRQDSSGFEHTFSGERYSNHVTGFHNWVRFYLEEKAGHINYLGYLNQTQPGILAAHFMWNGVMKELGSMWLRTSPEFEMAAYTTCFLVHKASLCRFHINGFSIAIQTYEFSGLPGDQIASAFVRL